LFGLGPFFLGYDFLGFFEFGCCWAANSFLEEFPRLRRPRCKNFSCSLIKESQKESKEGDF